MDNLLHDIRYAARTLLRSPGFTLAAVLTLGLGIGATTAIFSVVDGVLLRPLDYRDADRLVVLWRGEPGRPGEGRERFNLSDFSLIRSESRTLESAAAILDWNPVLGGVEQPERLQALWVSPSYFELLGAEPALGRWFLPGEETPDGARVVVLSHTLWQQRFHGATDIVGRPITLNEETYEVVGVAPAGFQPPLLDAGLRVPLRSDPEGVFRDFNVLRVLGRLQAGVTPAQALSELDALAARIAEEHPATAAGMRIELVPLKEQLVGGARPALLALLGAVGLMLLLACVNVANLLLARSSARQHELALRSALGARRQRLAQQLLTEGMALTFVGGLVGLLTAVWGVGVLVKLLPPDTPRLDGVAVDVRAIGFTAAVAAATGICFALLPALRGSRADLSRILAGGGRAIGGAAGHAFTRNVFVTAEIAIAMALLIAASLLMKSFLNLQREDPGFRASGILTVELSLPRPQYTEQDRILAFYDQLLERIRALPGVASAGEVSVLPLAGETYESSFAARPGLEPGAEGSSIVGYRAASADYFRTLGIPLLAGRSFGDDDHADAPPVVVINGSLARRLWPGENPVGRPLYPHGGPIASLTVVGVVGDVRHHGLDQPPSPELFRPTTQFRQGFGALVIRSDGDPLQLVPAVRREIRNLDPALPLPTFATMEQRVRAEMTLPRLYSSLFAAFAGLALLLAVVGIYGVTAYSVTLRTREIGIRAALGGRPWRLLVLVISQTVVVVGLGVTIGLGAALASTRLLGSLLYGLSPTDAATYASVAVLLAAAALGAALLPARRAARVDPMVALRAE